MKKFMIILVLLMCSSCSKVILHPIEKADIFRIKVGECGAEKDGWFVSDFYVDEVMNAKVED